MPTGINRSWMEMLVIGTIKYNHNTKKQKRMKLCNFCCLVWLFATSFIYPCSNFARPLDSKSAILQIQIQFLNTSNLVYFLVGRNMTEPVSIFWGERGGGSRQSLVVMTTRSYQQEAATFLNDLIQQLWGQDDCPNQVKFLKGTLLPFKQCTWAFFKMETEIKYGIFNIPDSKMPLNWCLNCVRQGHWIHIESARCV